MPALWSVSALIFRALLVIALAIGSGSAAEPRQPPEPNLTSEAPPPEWLIRNTIRWLPLIERWEPDFSDLEPALVLAIIAQESQGFPDAEGSDGAGSIGLMQIIARSWTGTRKQLLNPAYNIFVGMRMLTATIEKTGGDVRTAVAAYNCGFVSLEAGRCYKFGGYTYADRVLEYWVPIFRTELMIEPTATPATKPTLTEAAATSFSTPTLTAIATPSMELEIPTQTPAPEQVIQVTKETETERPDLIIMLGVLAIIGLTLLTIRDWKRLGGRNE